jgi:hypothetical protein
MTVIIPQAPAVQALTDTVLRFGTARFLYVVAPDFFYTRNSSNGRLSHMVPYSGAVDRPEYIK